MPSTSYQLAYRLPGMDSTVSFLIDIAAIVFMLWLSDRAAGLLFGGLQLETIATFIFFFGMIWLIVRLTRSTSTLELDDEGFTVQKQGRFDFLPKGAIRQSWRDFSYQSGALHTSKIESYELSIYLTTGKSFSFITGISPKEKEEIEQLHRDIETRVNAFRENAVVAV